MAGYSQSVLPFVVKIMEEWRDVVGLEGKYQVSSYGRARSLDRIIYKDGPKNQKYINHKGKLLGLKPSPNGYVYINLPKAKLTLLSRLICEAFLGPLKGKHVDHKDGDPSNNKLENLRLCTRQQNSWNSNKSLGVSFDKKRKKWRAYITKDDEQIWLGYHSSFEEARKARIKAELLVCGEFAPSFETKVASA